MVLGDVIAVEAELLRLTQESDLFLKLLWHGDIAPPLKVIPDAEVNLHVPPPGPVVPVRLWTVRSGFTSLLRCRSGCHLGSVRIAPLGIDHRRCEVERGTSHGC